MGMELNYRHLDFENRVRLNSSCYSTCSEILRGDPRRSILGHLLFNMLCDFFLFISNSDIASYADDNTPYYICQYVKEVIDNREKKHLKHYWHGLKITV